MSNIRTQIGKVVGKTLNSYHSRVKPKIDELKFKEQYQGRIIDCMVGEVDDNYIETPETDSSIVKLEHSKEGLVKVPSIKGKTILVDEDGNETDTPREGCRLVSVGEEEDNKLIILSKNEDNSLSHKTEILLNEPLRSLPNGVCDEIVGNQIIRRIGIINDVTVFRKNNVLSGTSGSRFIATTKDAKQERNIVVSCNIIPYMRTHSSYQEQGFYIATDEFTQNFGINIRLKEDIDLSEFRERFSKIEVLYELEEPIIEELPNSITLQGFDDTTMYIENSITPTVTYGYNALIPYKEELSKQKEEVETNTLDIEQNIIPYLMDMEFNLMLMEDK